MKRFKLFVILLSFPTFAFCQNEWNSTTSSSVPMYRNGFVGIGTGANPVQPLVVQDPTSGNGTKVLFGNNGILGVYGSADAMLQINSPSNLDGCFVHLSSGTNASKSELVMAVTQYGAGLYSSAGLSGVTRPISLYVGGTEAMRAEVGGKIRIGAVASTPGTYKLYVKDGILTEKVKVAIDATANWSDYVFAKGYKLKPLNELDAFIKKNKHLPGVPSAEEMVKEGLDVATMDAKLLEKIEELTLYVIELKKEVEKLKKDQNTLK